MNQNANQSQLLINGERCNARKGATFTRSNPIDGVLSTICASASTDDATAAVDAAG